MEFSENWILMALLTPTFWAMGCLLDSCLIGSRIYRKAADGAIVSCLFCLAPALLCLITMLLQSGSTSGASAGAGVPETAIAAGLAYALHLFYYFRTLYCLNDVSGAETFIALSVLFVPLFAWWLLGERLPAHFYLAFVLASVGIGLQCMPTIRAAGLPLLANMLITMIAVSLSMVWQSSALQTHGFITATAYFNSTIFSLALVWLVINRKTRNRIFQLCRRVPAVLITGELLGVLAILSSHRATQKGPSVSIVALIECLLPLIIIAISYVLISINQRWMLFSNHYESTLVLQIRGVPMKMCAMTLLVMSLAILAI
ncbi:MAG: hypothetical protein AB8B64_08305 [Granulosicoccus sp.]